MRRYAGLMFTFTLFRTFGLDAFYVYSPCLLISIIRIYTGLKWTVLRYNIVVLVGAWQK
jgi:hypothetical protein